MFIHLTIKIYQPKYIKTGFSNFFHTMVSLEDNLVAGQGSELKTHVYQEFYYRTMMKINHGIKTPRKNK